MAGEIAMENMNQADVAPLGDLASYTADVRTEAAWGAEQAEAVTYLSNAVVEVQHVIAEPADRPLTTLPVLTVEFVDATRQNYVLDMSGLPAHVLAKFIPMLAAIRDIAYDRALDSLRRVAALTAAIPQKAAMPPDPGAQDVPPQGAQPQRAGTICRYVRPDHFRSPST